MYNSKTVYQLKWLSHLALAGSGRRWTPARAWATPHFLNPNTSKCDYVLCIKIYQFNCWNDSHLALAGSRRRWPPTRAWASTHFWNPPRCSRSVCRPCAGGSSPKQWKSENKFNKKLKHFFDQGCCYSQLMLINQEKNCGDDS